MKGNDFKCQNWPHLQTRTNWSPAPKIEPISMIRIIYRCTRGSRKFAHDCFAFFWSIYNKNLGNLPIVGQTINSYWMRFLWYRAYLASSCGLVRICHPYVWNYAGNYYKLIEFVNLFFPFWEPVSSTVLNSWILTKIASNRTHEKRAREKLSHAAIQRSTEIKDAHFQTIQHGGLLRTARCFDMVV